MNIKWKDTIGRIINVDHTGIKVQNEHGEKLGVPFKDVSEIKEVDNNLLFYDLKKKVICEIGTLGNEDKAQEVINYFNKMTDDDLTINMTDNDLRIELDEKKQVKKTNKKGGIGCLILMIVGLIFLFKSCLMGSTDTNVKMPEQFNNNVFEQEAYKVFKDKLQKVEIDETEGIVWVHASVGDNFTNEFIRKGFLMEVMKYMGAIKNQNFGRICFDGYFDLVDQYNNKQNKSVIHIEFTKNTIDKMNFDNSGYNVDNLLDLGENLRLHPELQP